MTDKLPGKAVLLLLMALCLPGITFAQKVVLGTKVNSWLAGKFIRAYELVIYDMQSEDIEVLYSGNWGENFDAASFLADGSLVFSGRTAINIGESTYNPPSVGSYNWVSDTSGFYLSNAPNDVAAVHLIDASQCLIAFKVATQFGGLAYQVGDVLHYNKQTDVATLVFSHQAFFTVEEGGTYAAGNIDALAMTATGNLLLSTTNTAEIGVDSQSAVKVFQSGVYEVDLTTNAVSEFFDHNLITGPGVDIKAFSLIPNPLPDNDGDSVPDWSDQCQETPQGATINAQGCAEFELDSDNDGITDDIDQCPDTPQGEVPDANGCAWSERDDDSDGVKNGRDNCPDSPPGEIVNLIGCAKTAYGIPALSVAGQLFLFLAILACFIYAVREREAA